MSCTDGILRNQADARIWDPAKADNQELGDDVVVFSPPAR